MIFFIWFCISLKRGYNKIWNNASNLWKQANSEGWGSSSTKKLIYQWSLIKRPRDIAAERKSPKIKINKQKIIAKLPKINKKNNKAS